MGTEMHVGNYLGLVHTGEQQLAEAFATVAEHHQDEPDVKELCQALGKWSQAHVRNLTPFIERYGEERAAEPENLKADLFQGPRSGGLGLLRDLHDLWLMANESEICWM